MYATVQNVKNLLDMSQWDETDLEEKIQEVSIAVDAWVDVVLRFPTPLTQVELAAEPIIRFGASSFTVYLVLSTKLDGHSVETISLAMRRYEEAKDYLTAYANRMGITPNFGNDKNGADIAEYAFAVAEESVCI